MSLPPSRPTPLAPGLKLDRYELLCPIAEGGMASVWIARHSGKHGFEKFVAVKTVLPKFAADPRFQQMFQDEARIASRIEHPNVAQILDVGEQHEITYLVMEYVDGESLSTIHRVLTKSATPMPPGVILRIMADICGGLHTAHELRDDEGQLRGVVHRDVSPQNVLVNTKGVAKLIDFGIAKARDRVAGDTGGGQVKGKIRYMAPEQALGSPVDHRADLWAVGAILYHLLSGKPPYDGENDVQALMLLTSGRPPMPLPPGVHPAIAAVVMRALTASVDSRFSTAGELQQAIEDAMTEAGVETKHAGVALFLAEHVSDRAKKRKEAIAVGVEAAAERERYAEIMRSNVKVTGGLSGTVAGGSGALSGGFHDGSEPDASATPTGGSSGSASGSGGARNSSTSVPVSRSGLGLSPEHSETLGSAAMDVGVRPLRGRTLALAGAAAGAVLAAAWLVLLLTRPPADGIAAKAPPPTPTAPGPTVVAVTTPWSAAAATAPTVSAAADAGPAPSDTKAAAGGPRPAPPLVPPNVAAQGPAAHPPLRQAKPARTKTRVDDGF